MAGFEVSTEARRSISVASTEHRQQRVAHDPRKAEACEVDLRWPARRRPGVTHSASAPVLPTVRSSSCPPQLSNLSPPLTSRRVDAPAPSHRADATVFAHYGFAQDATAQGGVRHRDTPLKRCFRIEGRDLTRRSRHSR